MGCLGSWYTWASIRRQHSPVASVSCRTEFYHCCCVVAVFARAVVSSALDVTVAEGRYELTDHISDHSIAPLSI